MVYAYSAVPTLVNDKGGGLTQSPKIRALKKIAPDQWPQLPTGWKAAFPTTRGIYSLNCCTRV
jgi:hypothetical protein